MKAKIKRRKQKPTALVERMIQLLIDILSGIISGLTAAAIIKWLDW